MHSNFETCKIINFQKSWIKDAKRYIGASLRSKTFQYWVTLSLILRNTNNMPCKKYKKNYKIVKNCHDGGGMRGLVNRRAIRHFSSCSSSLFAIIQIQWLVGSKCLIKAEFYQITSRKNRSNQFSKSRAGFALVKHFELTWGKNFLFSREKTSGS